ncbi:Vacuole effluxer Atg22 like domain containing protein [Lactarius tabidus]
MARQNVAGKPGVDQTVQTVNYNGHVGQLQLPTFRGLSESSLPYSSFLYAWNNPPTTMDSFSQTRPYPVHHAPHRLPAQTVWPLSGLLSTLAKITFSASIVVLNLYLPYLAASSLPSSDHGDTEKLSRVTAGISSLGIALGYTAGTLLLLAVLFPVQVAGYSTKALRFAIAGSGAYASQERLVTEEREGLLADDRPGATPALAAAEYTVRQEVVDAWKRLGSMRRWYNIQRLRNTFRYLAAWFLLSDSFTTLTSTALLFAKTTFHMLPSSLVLVGVFTPSSGILGALVWPAVQPRLGLSSLRVLILLVSAASAIPLYGVFGLFAPRCAKWGLHVPAEMYMLAVYFGALYAEIIPPGEEARWYGLFSITDKSSSFIGPLVVGIIADRTGNISVIIRMSNRASLPLKAIIAGRPRLRIYPPTLNIHPR